MGHYCCHYCQRNFLSFNEYDDHVMDKHMSSYDSNSETDCDNETVAPRKKDYFAMREEESESDDVGTDVDSVSDVVLDDDDRDEDFVPEERKLKSQKKSNSKSGKKATSKKKTVKSVMEDNESEEVVNMKSKSKSQSKLKSQSTSGDVKKKMSKVSKGKQVIIITFNEVELIVFVVYFIVY